MSICPHYKQDYVCCCFDDNKIKMTRKPGMLWFDVTTLKMLRKPVKVQKDALGKINRVKGIRRREKEGSKITYNRLM